MHRNHRTFRISWISLLVSVWCSAAGFAQLSGVYGFDSTETSPAAAPPAPPTIQTNDLRKALWAAYNAQPVAPRADRHALRARLALKYAEQVKPNLIIAFEGTGAFEPRSVDAMLSMKRFGAIPRDNSLNFHATEVFEAKYGRSGRYSALRSGPLTQLLAHPEYLPGGFNWMSFPSEETEVLAGGEEIKSFRNILGAGGDMMHSVSGTPRGLREAVLATKAALERAAQEGVSPRLIVFAHSSGCRTAVKYMEALKKVKDPRTDTAPIQAQLVFTLDPVKEAHEAVSELVRDGKRAALNGDIVFGKSPDVKPSEVVLVDRAFQPRSLYKTSNAERWVTVFQVADTLGMKQDFLPRHGIHGSPIVGADWEKEITFEDPKEAASGHGTIGTAAKTLKLLAEELQRVGQVTLTAPAPRIKLTERQRARIFYDKYLFTPLKEWRDAPFFDDLEESNDFVEALVAGIQQDPTNYEAFRKRVHAAAPGKKPVLNWLRYSWNQYLRLYRAKYKGGSRKGMTVDDGLFGDGDLLLRGKDKTDWKNDSEANMKKVSKAIAKADF